MTKTPNTTSPRGKHIASLGVAAALLACGSVYGQSAGAADAQAKEPSTGVHAAKKHSVSISIKETAIYYQDGPVPGPPVLAKEAGFFTGSMGSGVNKTIVRVIDGKGTREFFTRAGTFRGSFVFHGAHQANGDTIIGTLTVTKGTGKFHGAHGKLRINGFHNDSTGYSTEHLTGTLAY